METEPLNLRERKALISQGPTPLPHQATELALARRRGPDHRRSGRTTLAQRLHRPDLREPVKIHTNLHKP